MIKTVLALENRTIPPNIKFSSPNPNIPFESANLTVPTRPTPWPHDRLERVSVNSFGVGGSNAHVVIDSGMSFRGSSLENKVSDEPHLLLFSANSENALTIMTNTYRDYVGSNPEVIGDLAYTLANKRQQLPYRTYAVASKGTFGATGPVTRPAKRPSVVAVFTGQGAQWPRMGRDLLLSSPTFLNSIRRMDTFLSTLNEHTPTWNIEVELQKLGKKSRVHSSEFSQPLCTAIQIALVDVLSTLEIQLDAVVGHSSGEIAGAYAAGALTAEEAILVAMYRGTATQQQSKSGLMAVVGMAWDEVKKYLIPSVNVACENSPRNVTISGDADGVEAVIADIQNAQPDAMVRKLQVNKAYHSYHMSEVGEYYRSLLDNRVNEKEPTTLFFSSVTGALMDKSTTLGAEYWQRNLESPVLFRSAISAILQHQIGKHALFLEIGPHSALAAPLRQNLTQGSNTILYTPTMIRNRNCAESLLSAVGKLHTLQVPINLKALIPVGSCLTNLPPYPWDHEESYWYESRLSRDYRLRKFPHHDLLGARVVESTDIEPSWRNLFHLNTAPWVRDHKVGDEIVFPFAGYVAIAGEAIRQITGLDDTFRIQHIIVSTALVIIEGKPTEIITTCRPHRLTDTLNSKWWEFTIAAHNGSTWTKHCTGKVMAQSEGLESYSTPEIFPRKIAPRNWFATLEQAGLDLGPSFRNLEKISACTVTQQATARLLNNRYPERACYHIHPTVIDSALQLIGIASTNGEARKFKVRLPTSCDEFSVSRTTSDFDVSVTTQCTSGNLVGRAHGIADGTTAVSISGLKLSPVDNSDPTEVSERHATARLEWGPDVDFEDIKGLIKSSDDQGLTLSLKLLCVLCTVHSQRCAATWTTESTKWNEYRVWINDQFGRLGMTPFKDLDQETISCRIDDIVHDLSATQASSAAAALQMVCRNMDATHEDTLREDVFVSQMDREYLQTWDDWDTSLFIQHLAHCKPNLRVLEIGSWRSSPSKNILKSLTLPNGRTLCSKYTFTSQGYVSAQDQLTKFPNMEYVTFDINEDPLEHGLDSSGYDLVIASNIWSPNRHIGTVLRHIRKLLHPTGHLVLQESSDLQWADYLLDGRPPSHYYMQNPNLDEPSLSSRVLRHELIDAGYTADICELSRDTVLSCHLDGIFIARPSTHTIPAKPISLLCRDATAVPSSIQQHLQNRGFQVARCTLDDTPLPEQDVIALLDMDGPFFENIDPATYEKFRHFLQNLQNAGILWLTRLSQTHCQDPRFAQAIGTARTIRSELLIDFATCEVDDMDASITQIIQVIEKFQKRDTNDMLKPDFEYCIFDGVINVGRFYPFELSDDLKCSDATDRAILDISLPGRPSTLHWARKPSLPLLQPDEVEVEVYAVGLNFRVSRFLFDGDSD